MLYSKVSERSFLDVCQSEKDGDIESKRKAVEQV